jgi:hypothetical protein
LASLTNDILEHWCYVPPTPAPGGNFLPNLTFFFSIYLL